MADLPIPEFIDDDPSAVLTAIIADYETRTGKTLQPAQIERLLINAFAYRESLVRTVINETAKQNLVAFATFPIIDYLGQLVGVTRIAPSSATCTVRFTLISSHTGVTIDEGTRIASVDGKATFETTVPTVVNAGVTTADVQCEAITAGTEANGYTVGQITAIVNPQVWMVSASNLNTTAGGSAEETDEQLRERIKLAPASFSNAGSRDAYKFFASGANASIIDVAVIGPPTTAPGNVIVYPFLEGGQETPLQVLQAVEAALNSESVRPLTDNVTVVSPTKVEYSLAVGLVVLEGANQSDILASVTAILTELTVSKYLRLGRDLTHSEIIAACMIDGVYTVAPVINSPTPVNPLVIEANEFAFATGITVTITGTNVG